MASLFTSCRAYQRQVLSAFTGLGIQTSHTSRLAPISRRRSDVVKSISRRQFHPSSRTWAEQDASNDGITTEPSQDNRPETADAESTSTSTPPSKEAHVPWYLQVSPPEPLSTSLTPNIAAQELPPLPSDPPAILEALLHHLSITIGLDNLSIIDLRNLNPPSALGANLLMILGTARSEKHLNTSADRFCRWLRTTYKLRPYADGLLGRQELKLKLRRRNKKMKLAQSVGNTMFDGSQGKNIDDGITTGWVCCNLGDVSLAVLPDSDASQQVPVQQQDDTDVEAGDHPSISQKDQERILDDEDDEYKNPAEPDYQYAGFGSAVNAPRIVVQMFTEEKRLEMDLEGMWEARMKRREAKEQKQAEDYETSLFDATRFETVSGGRTQGRASRI